MDHYVLASLLLEMTMGKYIVLVDPKTPKIHASTPETETIQIIKYIQIYAL